MFFSQETCCFLILLTPIFIIVSILFIIFIVSNAIKNLKKEKFDWKNVLIIVIVIIILIGNGVLIKYEYDYVTEDNYHFSYYVIIEKDNNTNYDIYIPNIMEDNNLSVDINEYKKYFGECKINIHNSSHIHINSNSNRLKIGLQNNNPNIDYHFDDRIIFSNSSDNHPYLLIEYYSNITSNFQLFFGDSSSSNIIGGHEHSIQGKSILNNGYNQVNIEITNIVAD